MTPSPDAPPPCPLTFSSLSCSLPPTSHLSPSPSLPPPTPSYFLPPLPLPPFFTSAPLIRSPPVQHLHAIARVCSCCWPWHGSMACLACWCSLWPGTFGCRAAPARLRRPSCPRRFQCAECLGVRNTLRLLCVPVSVRAEFLGARRTYDLKEGGSEIPVAGHNVKEFVDLYVQHVLYIFSVRALSSFLGASTPASRPTPSPNACEAIALAHHACDPMRLRCSPCFCVRARA